MSINSIFSVARSSLFAHQQALAVTSTNLANVNNPTYSRQIVQFGTTSPDHRASFSFGTGVAVNDVLRIRNDVTDNQIRTNNHGYYDSQQKADTLLKVESFFSEPSEFGLSNLMTQFFNSWDELALDPQSASRRTEVIQSGQLLAEKVGSIYSGITQTKSDVKTESVDLVKNVNTILEQLNLVNKQIYEASVVNSSANDLIDKRDELLEGLSQYVNMNVYVDENNVASVSIGGVFAVDGLHFIQFDVEEDNGELKMTTAEGAVSANISGGSMSALLDLYNNELPEQRDEIDLIVSTLMENVNAIHSQGYSITEPAQTGLDFFSKYENGELEINQDLLDDPYNIAISKDGTSGNNEIALQLAELKNSKMINNKTIHENYTELVSSIGNEINLHKKNAESYGIVLTQLEQAKMEYSGVSTDEEMMNVLKYQRSYDAAAKLVTVADELMQTLLTLV